MIDALLAALIVAAGSCLQGAVGFGVNLVATPLLLLIDDVYVPGPVILASGLLNVLISRREHARFVDAGIDRAIVGQIVGAVAAGVVLALVPTGSLSVVFAACVLAAVAVSASGVHIRRTRRTLVGAGTASGFMGTLSGIGGPPIALLYQHVEVPVIRATLARFFLAGMAVSIPILVLVGELDLDALTHTLILLPGIVVGFWASKPLVRRLDQRSIRPYILGLSAAAAVAVLIRELV